MAGHCDRIESWMAGFQHGVPQCAFAASSQLSAISLQPGDRRPIGVYRRSSAAQMVFANERTPCSATKPLEIVPPRKEFEV